VIVDTMGGPLTVATFGNNDFFGETAILCDVPRTATVQAKSELITLRIAKELFFRLGTEFPQMTFEVMREIALRLEKTTNDLQKAKDELTQVKAKLDAVGA
jgi:CRP-like cAMP-binding protein